MLGSKTCYYTTLWQSEGWPGYSDPPVPALTGLRNSNIGNLN